ncbi:unnamed protein product [Blepharisma stoltei]|uniref:Uncharacterized protein n=1 Tax=Blepharisma stoltei TaxID=1481888 RepID=A0AAU9IK18_9CILI|nr:unnamed protein product [Blepharisma stoltei]
MSIDHVQGTIELLRSASKAALSPMKFRFKKELCPDHLPPAVLFPHEPRLKIRSKSTTRIGKRQKSLKQELDREYKDLILKTDRLMHKKVTEKEEGHLDLTRISPLKLPYVIRDLAKRTAVITKLKTSKTYKFLDSSKLANDSKSFIKGDFTIRMNTKYINI